MEKRPAMDGSYTRRDLVLAGDNRDGVPNRYRINKRNSHSGVPKSDGNSRDRRSRDPIHWTGIGISTELPAWYQYLAIVISITAIVVFLIASLM